MTIHRLSQQNRMLLNFNRLPFIYQQKTQTIRAFATDTKHDDYQYLQRGQIPMLHFQRSLPRLKIPRLELTCDRFLAAVHPLSVHETAYTHFVDLVKRFRTTGNGPQLQKLLIAHDRANCHTSYISEPWFDMYLKDRKPLPINYNPVLIMKPDPKPEYNDQLLRTANLVITSLRFMRSLREELLEPEVYHLNPAKSDTDRYRRILRKTPTRIASFVSYLFKAFPLDMSQYEGLFGATRIPEKGKDRIKRADASTHICVMRNGHFYAVNVIDDDGNIVPPSAIISRLRFVANDVASNDATEHPLGVLTAENRDTWATMREHLVNTHNEQALETIDSALFCVSLDDKADYNLADPVPIVKNMLHGDKHGLINRWFDKSVSLIVCKDGNAGVIFEHSWGDGVAVLRFFNEIYKETVQSPICHPSDVQNASGTDVSEDVFKIDFHLDDKSKNGIKQATLNYKQTIASLEMHAMIYPEMNKAFCKMHKVSPDAVMQLGFQLAYLKQHGKYVGTYESCSTAAFRHGRTETIRPCTTDTKAFCDAIVGNSPQASGTELREMILQCSKTHGKLIREAAVGEGFDRHLFGLKHMAELNEIPLDPIYYSDAYQTINYNILSTSSLASDGLLAGCFGPVVSDGYGIGYNVQDTMLGVIFTNYAKEKNGNEFVDCLRESYDDIRKVLEYIKKPNNEFYD